LVRLTARPPNVEGAGAVGLRDLVRQALRMRPDRIVVGEFRGGEVADLLVALNTGHDGGAATVHANTAAAVPARLEALGMLAGLAADAVARLASTALQVVVHVERSGGARQVTELAVLVLDDEGRLQTVPAWTLAAGVGHGAPILAGLLRDRAVDVPVALR
jgi:pilus assembly protein CpaF